ncbi:peptide chain release factor N(5)-glutamine methyltransferase [Evansella sp. LMS18]|jgi:release factor glutamine methyltransferase|uniref:peptide chain release factor N(5)-glutamine methyltransferase n=1 Tax=Evansella sp. LMS18 TaxID=2924033 RepID=UPI0020D12B9B|nr:peptide chain release factor N(5)-glutamine methyltransferase [Evansella sp. LMS18]UTR12220.1 peptide chain release factor N(5)-glutamine methyltransferase [Evansella sp. LMS18]
MEKNNPGEKMKVYEALKWASSFLEEHGYEAAIGEILLRHHTGWSRTRLFSENQSELSRGVLELFQADVEKSVGGVPVQHLTGEESFYGRTFQVTSDTLIPRPETEELVEAVLEKLSSLEKMEEDGPVRIVDVGTGSGIIAATLALELEGQAAVTAVDISAGALKVAEANSRRLGAKVRFLEGDLLRPLIEAGEKVRAVVSNPPYIPEGDRHSMKENVVGHEPELALFAGEDGLSVYRKLVKQIPEVLDAPGLIAFEIGHGQGKAVKSLILETFPDAEAEVRLDINGKERIVLALIMS